jgi:hypothetical protein
VVGDGGAAQPAADDHDPGPVGQRVRHGPSLRPGDRPAGRSAWSTGRRSAGRRPRHPTRRPADRPGSARQVRDRNEPSESAKITTALLRIRSRIRLDQSSQSRVVVRRIDPVHDQGDVRLVRPPGNKHGVALVLQAAMPSGSAPGQVRFGASA